MSLTCQWGYFGLQEADICVMYLEFGFKYKKKARNKINTLFKIDHVQ